MYSRPAEIDRLESFSSQGLKAGRVCNGAPEVQSARISSLVQQSILLDCHHSFLSVVISSSTLNEDG